MFASSGKEGRKGGRGVTQRTQKSAKTSFVLLRFLPSFLRANFRSMSQLMKGTLECLQSRSEQLPYSTISPILKDFVVQLSLQSIIHGSNWEGRTGNRAGRQRGRKASCCIEMLLKRTLHEKQPEQKAECLECPSLSLSLPLFRVYKTP